MLTVLHQLSVKLSYLRILMYWFRRFWTAVDSLKRYTWKPAKALSSAKQNLKVITPAFAFNEVPLSDYFPIYSMMTKSTVNELKPEPSRLLAELETINKYAIRELNKLTDKNLDEPLEQTKMVHPIAKTKYEALTWSFRHEMWHLGQISTLKRIIGHPTRWHGWNLKE